MVPQKIALLTDSCADLSDRLAADEHIYIVPLRILCADGEYADGVNIHGRDIYRRLRSGELPQTSLPSVESVGAVLEEIRDAGYDGVIAVMLSSGLSGTYNLVRLVAEESGGFANSNPRQIDIYYADHASAAAHGRTEAEVFLIQ